tara:strand:- start:23768 stop:24970 length:1203 start_codon:yes stop_codon:yes gene_type:complete
MKKYLVILILLIESLTNAQTRISGKVLDSDNLPLEDAAVYLNNTSIGTTTNELGEFELYIKDGVYTLIVSYLGYETIQYQIDTKKPIRKFTFKAKETGNVLDEITLNNKKHSAEDRAYFLSRFRNSFIGKTLFSENCKIANPDVIQFDFNPLSKVLEAYVSNPIEIINKDLGYKIYYDLVHYELSVTKITYLGYSRYEQIKGGKSKRRKWNKNRLRAYNGSKMHFIRAARKGNLTKEGFVMSQYKRIPNPDRPSDGELKETRKYLRTLNIEPKGTKIFRLSSKKDSVMEILKKSRLKKFLYLMIKDSLIENDFLVRSNDQVIMKFTNYLNINYMNEKEEYNFRPGPNRLNYQSSKLVLFTDSVLLDQSGIFTEPLDVLMEGYWGYEKISDALPLDYITTE